MVHGRSQNTCSQNLPRLSADGGSTSNTPSASLRGKYHQKVPDISNQPLNTLLPILKDGVQHPQPYYLTQNVVLKISANAPIWKNDVTAVEPLREVGNSSDNKKLQNNSSEKIVQNVVNVDKDNEYQSKPKVDTMLVEFVEKQIVKIVVDLTAEICWALLWDDARKQTQKKLEQLELKFADLDHEPDIMRIIKPNFNHPLSKDQGSPLHGYAWDLLLYETNYWMQRGSVKGCSCLAEELQEQIIAQVAGTLMLEETIGYVSQEIDFVNEEERILRPKRKRTIVELDDSGKD